MDRGALCSDRSFRPLVQTDCSDLWSAGVCVFILGCPAAMQDSRMAQIINAMVLASMAYDPASRLGGLKSPAMAAMKQDWIATGRSTRWAVRPSPKNPRSKM